MNHHSNRKQKGKKGLRGLANKPVTSGNHNRGRGCSDDRLDCFSGHSLLNGTHRWGVGVRRFRFGRVLRFGFGRVCRGRGMGLRWGLRWGRADGGWFGGGRFGGAGKGAITTYKRGGIGTGCHARAIGKVGASQERDMLPLGVGRPRRVSM